MLGNAWLALGTASNLMEQFVPALVIFERAQCLFAQQNDVLGIARCQWQRGIALQFQDHLDESIELLQKTISTLEKQGMDFELARAQRDLAMAYNLVEDFDKAGMMIETARAFFQSKNHVIQTACCDLVNGTRLRHLTRYQEALEVLENARQIFQSADRPIEQGRALFIIGLIYIQLQKYDQALLHQQQTHEIFSSIGLRLRVAYCRLALGRIAWRLGKLRQARSDMESALDCFEQNGIVRYVADCLLNLGNVAYVEGDYYLAQTRYEHARLGYARLKLEIYVARCDQNLGLVFHQQGQWSVALDRFHRAADEMEKRQIHVWAADCYYEMANIYADLQQRETALLYLERAIQKYRREKVSLGEAQCEVLGSQIIDREKEFTRALSALERARQAAVTTGSLRYVALCDRMIGDLLLAQEQFSEAIQQYETARDHFASAGTTADQAFCLVGIGKAYARSGDLDQAEENLRTALGITTQALLELNWHTYTELGRIAKNRGENDQALRHFQQAIQALRATRSTLPEIELAGGFAASSQQVYNYGIRAALEQGDYELALEFTEESRSRILGRMVRAASRHVDDEYVQDLFGQEAELRATIIKLRQQLLCSFQDHTQSSPAMDSNILFARVQDHRNEHRRILQKLHVATNGQIETLESFRWARFRAWTDSALPAKWLALVYYWLDEELLIFSVDSDQVRLDVRHPNRVELNALAMGTLTAPERRQMMFQGNMYGEVQPSRVGEKYRRVLYDLLLPEQVAHNLSPDQLLLIVPHGRLHHLPFQCLENPTGFLVEQAIISLVPSLGVLEGLMQRAAHGQEAQKTQPHALIVGLDSFQQPRPALHWTTRETDDLAAIYGQRCDYFKNERVTTEALEDWNKQGLLNRYNVLHIASHAYLDSVSGALSSITLWDNEVTTWEISHLRLNRSLVTLSACQSGLGEIRPGDEIMSLPHAFFAAGAQTVVVSQWHVDDESTSDLMTAFHEYFCAGMSPAAALMLAQRRAIQYSDVSPYQWGAFVTTGMP